MNSMSQVKITDGMNNKTVRSLKRGTVGVFRDLLTSKTMAKLSATVKYAASQEGSVVARFNGNEKNSLIQTLFMNTDEMGYKPVPKINYVMNSGKVLLGAGGLGAVFTSVAAWVSALVAPPIALAAVFGLALYGAVKLIKNGVSGIRSANKANLENFKQAFDQYFDTRVQAVKDDRMLEVMAEQ